MLMLKKIVYYNREKVTQEDISEQRNIKLNSELLLRNVYVVNTKPRFLNYSFVSDILSKQDQNDEEKENKNTTLKQCLISKIEYDTEVLIHSTDFLTKVNLSNDQF